MKRLAYIVSILAMVGLLVATSYAHSGRTDRKGGHYNRSTGKYHYHHGYPAHDHYDIDGDGKADCPYKFNDKTDHSNHGSSSNSTNKKNDKSTTSATEIKVETFTENTETDSTNNKITFEIVIKIIFIIVGYSIVALICGSLVVLLVGIAIDSLIVLTAKKIFKSSINDTALNRVRIISYIIPCVLVVILVTILVLKDNNIL